MHNSLSPVSVLARSIQSMHLPPPSHFVKTRFNIILPTISGSSKWSLSLMFPHQNPICTSPAPRTCYVPHPFYSSWFDHSNNIWQVVHILKLLVVITSLKWLIFSLFYWHFSNIKSPFGWSVPLSAPFATRIQLKIVIFTSPVMMHPRVQQLANIWVLRTSLLLVLVTVTTDLLYTVICIEFETLDLRHITYVILQMFLDVANKCEILIPSVTGCSDWPPYTTWIDTNMKTNWTNKE